MKVQIDQKDVLPREKEVIDYELDNPTTIEQSHERLKKWFKDTPYLVGRGGSHVWVSLRETGKRLVMFYDYNVE